MIKRDGNFINSFALNKGFFLFVTTLLVAVFFGFIFSMDKFKLIFVILIPIALLGLVFFSAEFLGLWFGGIECLFRFISSNTFGIHIKFISVLGLSVLIYLFKKRKSLFPPQCDALYFNILFLVLYFIGSLTFDYYELPWEKFKNFLSLNFCSFLFVLYFKDNSKELCKIVQYFLLGSLIVVFSSILLTLLGLVDIIDGIMGIWSDKILYGKFAGGGAILLISLSFSKWWKNSHLLKKFMLLILSTALFICAVISGQRGALLSILVSLMCFFIIYYWMKKKIFTGQFLFVSFFLCVILCLSIFFLPTIFTERFFTLFNETQQDYSFLERKSMYILGYDLFLKSPIWGNGVYSFIQTNWAWPHNIFLEIMVELGSVGLFTFLLYLFAIVKAFFRIIKSKYDNKEYVLAMFCCLIFELCYAQVSSDITGNYRIWLYSGLVYAFYLNARQNGYIVDKKNLKSNQI